ncbi:hypothetical protein QJS04_geneDACA014718 [Acorus gramineus]|uniref:Uncharacterized protein n=1 Tax=Acorus gramineus TaxID=55184 RepID=A0AAV9A0Y3_ACOGR|nr:hypothetical protein QJS04_geneDACA014718 [Acorus gramineus]
MKTKKRRGRAHLGRGKERGRFGGPRRTRDHLNRHHQHHHLLGLSSASSMAANQGGRIMI